MHPAVNNDLVGIPDDMYVDLKQFATSADLQKILDELTLKKITAMREAHFGESGSPAFAEGFEKVVAQTVQKK